MCGRERHIHTHTHIHITGDRGRERALEREVERAKVCVEERERGIERGV